MTTKCGLGCVCHWYKHLEPGNKGRGPVAHSSPSSTARSTESGSPRMSWLLGRQKTLSENVTTDLFNHRPVTELIRLRALGAEWFPHLEWFYNSGNSSQKANCRRRESRHKHNSSPGDSAYGWVTVGHLGVIDGPAVLIWTRYLG